MLGERIEHPGVDPRWDYHADLEAAAVRAFIAGHYIDAVQIKRAAYDVAQDIAADEGEVLL
jgi:hypothetical protein